MSENERSYLGQVERLAPLEAFDPQAFVGDGECSKEVCDFVLALALAFNDLKDVLVGHWLLLKFAPTEERKPDPALGTFMGLHMHFLRQMCGCLWEVTELIQKREVERNDPFFVKVIRGLPPEARKSWTSVVDAAKSSTSSNPLTRFIVRARHKVAFHYDPAEIGRGFRLGFPAGGEREPLVSRGSNLAETRFYFADAAAQDYLREVLGNDELESFLKLQPTFIDDVATALFQLVTKFINARGSGWRRA